MAPHMWTLSHFTNTLVLLYSLLCFIKLSWNFRHFNFYEKSSFLCLRFILLQWWFYDFYGYHVLLYHKRPLLESSQLLESMISRKNILRTNFVFKLFQPLLNSKVPRLLAKKLFSDQHFVGKDWNNYSSFLIFIFSYCTGCHRKGIQILYTCFLTWCEISPNNLTISQSTKCFCYFFVCK